ncbi:alpha-2-macroglobulin family protein [Aurantimonas sp. VKM B-3413]|uniref:alpha-2-macroglobulin family protein n=1 Tax=Aurantimonas sp. VKM B-3413 TaxID=2779401 RepID=UPI001E28A237|nr:alpha-2-macroglobulin family protein [Aurantimonas sp. VKM B-3413]MCB8838843.1 alpha-2-macroglobulin family protein [Aurantimonas sp. VKM B-3413]
MTWLGKFRAVGAAAIFALAVLSAPTLAAEKKSGPGPEGSAGAQVETVTPEAAQGGALATGAGTRQIVVTKGADYFGRDYDVLKDVGVDQCSAACVADKRCLAFTLNERTGWCFMKEGLGELRTVAGATSGRIVEAPAIDETSVETRVADLDFLARAALDEAKRRRLALASADRDPNAASLTVQDLAAKAGAALTYQSAIEYYSEVLKHEPLNHRAWNGLAQAALNYSPDDYQKRMENAQLRSDAAINAYLTSASDAERAAALAKLGDGFASASDWKQAIRSYRKSLALAEEPTVVAQLDSVVAAHGFRIVDHTIDNNAANPRICLTFSDALSAKLTSAENPGDYLGVEGGDTLPVTASGTQMCVEGVKHGERYHIVARPGITSVDGETLPKQAVLDIYVKDRDPSVRFATNAYVLPAGGNATIPVTTINTAELEAKLQRIDERGLTDAIGGERFLRELSQYQVQDITDQSGEDVWQGRVDVVRDLNREVVTAIPVSAIAPDLKPGVYVLTATAKNGPKYQDTSATQWFVVSDIGLTTFSASDGFHVVARSLGSAAPLGEVDLGLVAANNQVLGTARTDASGHARFPAGLLRGTGGERPAVLTANRQKSDFVFLDLTASPFDLTDRGVDGRAPAGPLDVFITPERGIYRAGDTAYLTAMTRDSQGIAITGLTLTEIVTRPDGVEHARSQVSDFGAGGYSFPVALPPSAQRGVWKVALHTDPKQPALAEASFLVEDFEPQKIDFDLTIDAKVLDPASPPVIDVSARYLFGAPAGGLEVNGEAVLTSTSSIDGFPGYSFGLATDETTATRQPFDVATTDETGAAEIAPVAFDPPVTTRPLSASLQVRVVDAGGRPVEKTTELPLAGSKPRLGIKPRVDGDVAENSLAAFDVIAIGADRMRMALPKADWVLKKVTTRFQWYSTGSGWNYEPIRSTARVASGTVEISPDQPAAIEAPVEWGEYELTLSDPSDEAVPASVTFYAGWYVAAASLDTPDTARVSLDKPQYKVGDTATVHIEPRFAGKAEVFVMDERVVASKTADIGENGGDVTLEVTRDWGPGVYIAAVVYRPMDLDEKRMPGRAIGLAHASVDPGDRALSVSIAAPDKIAPRQSINVSLDVGGVKPGETAYVTLAAVDVGILNVTRFDPPSPKGFYFGKRRLGVEIRDLYSKLIDRTQGAPGTVRSGGDAGASYESPPPMDDLVARYSGPVTVGDDGKVVIPLDVPDFNGTLKLMAMAWSKTGVGEASADMIVRDPIVMAVSRPRFLSPGDTSRIAIDLTHVEGPTGRTHVVLSGGAGIASLGGEADRTIEIADGGHERMLVPVKAEAIGDAAFDLALTMPNGETLRKNFRLPVRSIAPETVDKSVVTVAANGGRLALSPDLFAGYVPGTGKATLSIAGATEFDVAGVVRALDRYPYGCTEQLTSRALPLVYLDKTILAAGLGATEDVTKRVEDAVTAVLANQSSSGSFGLWQPDSGDLWLDAYVTDFLTRARETGYKVPEEGFSLAIDNLRNSLAYLPDQPDWGPVAYAYYVLARNGRAAIGDLRYYVDNQVDSLPTPLAKAQMAAALALYGDRTRAETVFRRAVDQATNGYTSNRLRTDYGTALRDDAAVLTLGLETAIDGVAFDGLVRQVNAERQSKRYTSTQEDVWSLLAAHALLTRQPPQLTVAGKNVDGPYAAAFDAQSLAAGLDIANRGPAPLSARVTLRGVPEVTPPASVDGYAISRSYYTLEGTQADPSQIGQGDRLVAVVEVTPIDTGPARLMINDPLPAGLEIDNPAILKGGDVAALDWLELSGEAAHTEFRADRFLAAVNQGDGDTATRRFAYIVRAVSPGTFDHPAAVVENMYDPTRRGRTDAGGVEVIGPLK